MADASRVMSHTRAPLPWAHRLETRRARQARQWRYPALAVAAAALAGLTPLRIPTVTLLEGLSAWPALPLGAAFLIAFRGGLQRWRQAHATRARSWLAAAPLPETAWRRWLRRQAMAAQGPCLLTLLGAPSAMALAAGAPLAPCLLPVASGAAAGVLAAAWAGRRPARERQPAAPRLRRSRVARTGAPASNLDGLARWPRAEWLAALEPRRQAGAFAVVLLALPAGAPLSMALGVLLVLAAGIGAAGLAQAERRAVRQALAWLQPLPIPARQIRRAMALRCMAVQAGLACVATAGLGSLGFWPQVLLPVVPAWIAAAALWAHWPAAAGRPEPAG